MRVFFDGRVPFWEAALVIFAFIVFVCDLVPKLFALGKPELVARIGVKFLPKILPALDPVCNVLRGLSERFADLLTPKKFTNAQTISEEELETLVELSAAEGAIGATEHEMIQEIIKMGDKTVKDCMTPRVQVFALPDDLTNVEVAEQLKRNRHRRIPIYADSPDNILGILDAKVFLFNSWAHYTEAMLPPSFVPETMKATDLLRSFLTHPQGMAVIVDEFGGTDGIITLADIIEDIVSDAVPLGDRDLYIEISGKNRLIASGMARLDDLSEYIGPEIEEEAEGVDTIGGLIFNRLGHIPAAGTKLQIGEIVVTVRKTGRKRIQEVMIDLDPKPKEGGTA
jgi:CBS domain containing-hemolysin-like protein